MLLQTTPRASHPAWHGFDRLLNLLALIAAALIPFMFAGALLWLLLHEQTRAYQRVWFR